MARTRYQKRTLTQFNPNQTKWNKTIKDNFIVPSQKAMQQVLIEADDAISKRIQEEAKDRCPIDTYSLEDSIVVKHRKRYGKTISVIEIEDRPRTSGVLNEDGDDIASINDAKTTGEYGPLVNDNFTPIGNTEPSEKSRRKKQKHGSPTVGGGFIERAITENEQLYKDMLDKIAYEVFERK